MLKPSKSGVKATTSGQYELVGPKGGHTGVERTVVASEPLPPTQVEGQQWVLVDKTRTKGK